MAPIWAAVSGLVVVASAATSAALRPLICVPERAWAWVAVRALTRVASAERLVAVRPATWAAERLAGAMSLRLAADSPLSTVELMV